MPTPIVPITIQAPGKKGLNSQESNTALDLAWATTLDNAVFDSVGRIASRKGITNLTTSGGPGANNLSQAFCWEGFNSNVPVTGVLTAGNLKLYTGTTSLSDITGTITAPTANNWQFMNFRSNKVIGVQQGHTPIVATIAAGALGNFANITAASGSLPTGNCGLAAFGRVWILDSDNTTVKYSALLDETHWSTGAGSIDTTLYWPKGRDYVVALAAWEDKLVIFGRHSIIIYSSPGVIASLALSNILEGVGCVARDSVRSIGTDVLFLSESGIRSLRQSIVTQKSPMQELSLPVRDSFLAEFSPGSASTIRSAFNQIDGIYIISNVGTSTTVTYAFDIKNYIQQQILNPTDTSSIRISRWSGWPVHAMAYGRNGVLYVTYRNGSNEAVGYYAGYYDGGTTSYTLNYSTPWVDLANPEGGESGTFLKIPKSANITTVGSSSYQVSIKLAFDFDSDSYVSTQSIVNAGTASEYGIAEYGISEYNAQNRIPSTKKFPLARFGQHMKLTVQIPISGKEISVQKIDMFFKKGRATT